MGILDSVDADTSQIRLHSLHIWFLDSRLGIVLWAPAFLVVEV